MPGPQRNTYNRPQQPTSRVAPPLLRPPPRAATTAPAVLRSSRLSLFQHPGDMDEIEFEKTGQFRDECEDDMERAMAHWERAWSRATEHASKSTRKSHAINCDDCPRGSKYRPRLSRYGSWAPVNELKAYLTVRDQLEPHIENEKFDSKELRVNHASVDTQSTLAEEVIEEPAFIATESSPQATRCKTTISITGMTCSACTSAVTHALEELTFVHAVSVALLTNSATVEFTGEHNLKDIVDAIEDAGFDASVEELEHMSDAPSGDATKATPSDTWQAQYAIGGMTCSACVSAITNIVQQLPFIKQVDINLISNSGTMVFDGKSNLAQIQEAIEDAGFEATLDRIVNVRAPSDTWKAQYAIGGMTCSACVSAITNIVQQLPFIKHVDINLISNSGTMVFDGKANLDQIQEAIEDAGFEATLDKVANVGQDSAQDEDRVVDIAVDGMHCDDCPTRILDALQSVSKKIQIGQPLSLSRPILQLKYRPEPPKVTIRHILAAISAVDPAYKVSIYHAPTIEERAKEIHRKERQRIFMRLALCVLAAIPTFIIGVVLMSLVSPTNPARVFMAKPIIAGAVSRTEWALFISSTPIYFFAADLFHRKALKEIRALWRPGSKTPILQRFYRFGSMNTLLSLGTTIAYWASITNLILTATESPNASMNAGNAYYFDSIVFLTMFLLTGRSIEAYSKAKTGDAVDQLGKLRPTEAILVEPGKGNDCKIPVDLLEVGDVVRVLNGSSPPFDGVVLSGEGRFDESSLTGESRPVTKAVGDTVYSGTVNKSNPVSISVTSIEGASMLDQIIKVVREGQTRRAPVERAADLITGHFVPVVVTVGILTWIVWLSLGLSGALPLSFRDTSTGGWPFWALGFAIAVFVVACPCGIGLAAPTAMFVGGGLAAQHGILVKGGGEAFQEASRLDVIVFDKTGTLTEGHEPAVTDCMITSGDAEEKVLGLAKGLEDASGHPVAKAIAMYCEKRNAVPFETKDISEVAGKGMQGTFMTKNAQVPTIGVILGNEALLKDHNVLIDGDSLSTIDGWKQQGKSVALLAVNSTVAMGYDSWTLAAAFAVADPLRPESAPTVRALQERGISVWMLSGDNPTTAQAVGAQLGIPSSNVIAGVLPDGKAEKIKYLQRAMAKPKKQGFVSRVLGRTPASTGGERAVVAMIGDGINDSPALTMADVGIAIGSGSDVAVSSADFVLISSNLTALLTLIDLSRLVFKRVWFNFGWALIYNLTLLPIAAGVLYPIHTAGGGHLRLDPVWASLAMALSSVSVVCSSLALRSGIPGIGFRMSKVALEQLATQKEI